MIKYARVINEETKLCSVILGSATEEFLKTNNYTEQDVSLSDIDNNWYLTSYCKMKTDEQKAQEEQERIAKLHLTKREVFLALYDDKTITPEQIRSQITDQRALIEFDYATEYYRFNPLIDQIGKVLGYTSEELDYLFEHKEFEKKEPQTTI